MVRKFSESITLKGPTSSANHMRLEKEHVKFQVNTVPKVIHIMPTTFLGFYANAAMLGPSLMFPRLRITMFAGITTIRTPRILSLSQLPRSVDTASDFFGICTSAVSKSAYMYFDEMALGGFWRM